MDENLFLFRSERARVAVPELRTYGATEEIGYAPYKAVQIFLAEQSDVNLFYQSGQNLYYLYASAAQDPARPVAELDPACLSPGSDIVQ